MPDHLETGLYFAYGSNMNLAQMASRCPGSTASGLATFADWRFVINERGVATIEESPGTRVLGVLWNVTADHIETLDGFEGLALGYYRRDVISVRHNGGLAEAYVYIDHRTDPGAPRPGYLERILAGANENGIPSEYIKELESWFR